MAQAQSKSFKIEDLRITIFDFIKKNDYWPNHIHTSESKSNHISVVSKGKILCHGHPEIEGRILELGQLIDWPVNKEHGFEALEDNSRLVNIVKQIIEGSDNPADYG